MEVAQPHKLIHCFHFLKCLQCLGKRPLYQSYNKAVWAKQGTKWVSGLDTQWTALTSMTTINSRKKIISQYHLNAFAISNDCVKTITN